MRNGRQVHDFLYAAAGEHGGSGLPAGIDVGMVAEDGKGMGGNGPCRHMEHAGQQFPGNFIQVRYHKEQSLGGGKGGGKRARRQGTVDGSRRACLRLHLRYAHGMPENIFPSFRRPFVGIFRHRGRRGYGIDGGCFGVCVGYVGGSLVAVHGFVWSVHF